MLPAMIHQLFCGVVLKVEGTVRLGEFNRGGIMGDQIALLMTVRKSPSHT